MKKIMKLLLICILAITTIQSTVLADDSIDTDFEIGTTTAIHESNDMIGKILGRLQVIGSVISVVALCVIGIRYMLSSLEEKAEMKGVIIYYVIGAVLIFATSNILSIVYNVINSVKY